MSVIVLVGFAALLWLVIREKVRKCRQPARHGHAAARHARRDGVERGGLLGRVVQRVDAEKCSDGDSYAKYTNESNNESLGSLLKAIELDPTFALAYAYAASCNVQRKSWGWPVASPAEDAKEAERLALKHLISTGWIPVA